MYRRTVRLFVILFSMLLLTACEFSASTANVKSATLARDANGTQPTTTFEPSDTFYLIVDLANAPDDTTVKAIWYAADVGSAAAPNTLIDQASLTSGSSVLTFNLSPESAWVPGTYKVELYLNDELNQTLNFSVNGEVVKAQPTSAPAAADPTAAPAAGSDLSTTLEGVRSATIRIQAEGSFIDPEFGEMTNAAGQGTGFIIDPSGIAVTNNHVVTGSAFLQVYVEGEDEPRNARILGVSECSDLAVIDIDGDGFPALQWREGDIPAGLEIYVAGFPFFGNEEFTLTRGIVSKASADGETNWASVDSVIEIDATINPGNSGGPLVDGDGRVVGVNYASSSGTDQYFTISRDEALPVIEQLRAGKDVNSIGINGQAVSDGESIFGIWASSVESGSPADKAGIKAGDILTKMEGLVLATDGTMSAYCDILRGHNMTDPMSVEVLRFADGTLLTGQLNGDPLEIVGTFGTDTGGSSGDTSGGATGGSYSEYVSVRDDSGMLQMSVPVEWSDIDGTPWTFEDEEAGPSLNAAVDVDGFYDNWTTPGAFLGASTSLRATYDPNSFLDQFDLSDSCTYDGRSDYSDELYTGAYDSYSNCGGTGTSFLVLVVEPESQGVLIILQVQMVTAADQEALQRILESFIYFGL
ncbi:MAG TPA: trypsin-like peptidase domain-containing protein [Promineifilum sp.]|nr:trypsin-like peptidase domain-containing protein [Promineifilum sp.]HRQ13182.1 trypsin-like peptidase domain-containing protein [Promineifilum sp.]